MESQVFENAHSPFNATEKKAKHKHATKLRFLKRASSWLLETVQEMNRNSNGNKLQVSLWNKGLETNMESLIPVGKSHLC